jgi:general secretion pathway protein G
MNNMRRGFTMIELIFVIVIIGILAAVAIPKLASNRDEAAAATCTQEVSSLVQEMATYYTKNGAWDGLARVTNVQTGVPTVAGNGRNGLADAAATVPAVGTGVTYVCNGEAIATITPTMTATTIRGVVHNELGLVTADPASATLQPGIISAASLTSNGFFKAAPGFVVGGN